MKRLALALSMIALTLGLLTPAALAQEMTTPTVEGPATCYIVGAHSELLEGSRVIQRQGANYVINGALAQPVVELLSVYRHTEGDYRVWQIPHRRGLRHFERWQYIGIPPEGYVPTAKYRAHANVQCFRYERYPAAFGPTIWSWSTTMFFRVPRGQIATLRAQANG
jgi:hypothetical protein